MKYWFTGIALSIVLCSLVMARSSVPALKAEDEIVKLERDWLKAEASGDLATLRGLLADDFIGTAFNSKVLTKDDIVPSEGDSTGRLPKSSLREATVRVFGDCAVLMGYVAMDEAKQPDGWRITSVYQKRENGWQMIAAHLSPSRAVEQ
jgi:ketosteroid isomerase-like protein